MINHLAFQRKTYTQGTGAAIQPDLNTAEKSSESPGIEPASITATGLQPLSEFFVMGGGRE